jgi:hypothetical protein
VILLLYGRSSTGELPRSVGVGGESWLKDGRL